MIEFDLLVVFAAVGLIVAAVAQAQGKVTRYVRYKHGGEVHYGILEGGTIRELAGSIFESVKATGRSVSLSDVKLLAPCEPSKVIAVGLNYRSHIGERQMPVAPGLFSKYPSAIIGPEEDIVYPPGAQDVHYEGEMVVVIGKTAKRITKEEAPGYIFGVTAGNDVSERGWQKNDLQWFRAKASDTFGPLGPVIVRGLDYNDLHLQTRLNGEVRQSQRTKDMVFNADAIVSYASQFVTLLPGDVIYTGTPGTTQPMKPGDVVEVELEGVGILKNMVAGPAGAD